MWNANSFSFPLAYIPSEQRVLLPEDIPAIEILPSATGEIGLGPISKIPLGAEIECCGKGFNEQTSKIRWRGKTYFIFREDLQTEPELAAKCAGC